MSTEELVVLIPIVFMGGFFAAVSIRLWGHIKNRMEDE